jgi:hypothetical protein
MSTVAETILQQLGGNKMIAMTGAHSLVAGQDSLQFKIKANAKDRINCLIIRLDSSDTYTVEFHSIRGTSFKLVDSQDMVYAEDLKRMIEGRTGLYLSL